MLPSSPPGDRAGHHFKEATDKHGLAFDAGLQRDFQTKGVKATQTAVS